MMCCCRCFRYIIVISYPRDPPGKASPDGRLDPARFRFRSARLAGRGVVEPDLAFRRPVPQPGSSSTRVPIVNVPPSRPAVARSRLRRRNRRRSSATRACNDRAGRTAQSSNYRCGHVRGECTRHRRYHRGVGIGGREASGNPVEGNQDSSCRNQALAWLHWFLTVRSEMSSSRAISTSVSPAKNRISTMRASSGSSSASFSSARCRSSMS